MSPSPPPPPTKSIVDPALDQPSSASTSSLDLLSTMASQDHDANGSDRSSPPPVTATVTASAVTATTNSTPDGPQGEPFPSQSTAIDRLPPALLRGLKPRGAPAIGLGTAPPPPLYYGLAYSDGHDPAKDGPAGLPPFPHPYPDGAAEPGSPSQYSLVGGVPRLPPILQVEKQQVTTSATQAASASRRRNEANFSCPVPGCGSTFTRRFNLRGHLRSHTEERPYVCEWPGCGKGFARQHDCKRHQNLHVARGSANVCHGCQKTFSRLDALNRHLRSDGGADCRARHQAALAQGNPAGDNVPSSAAAIAAVVAASVPPPAVLATSKQAPPTDVAEAASGNYGRFAVTSRGASAAASPAPGAGDDDWEQRSTASGAAEDHQRKSNLLPPISSSRGT